MKVTEEKLLTEKVPVAAEGGKEETMYQRLAKRHRRA
jgi:hypothetical protein